MAIVLRRWLPQTPGDPYLRRLTVAGSSNTTLLPPSAAWHWAGNAPTFTFLLQPPKAVWAWVGRAAHLSGGNIPVNLNKGYDIMRGVMRSIMRGITRPPMQ